MKKWLLGALALLVILVGLLLWRPVQALLIGWYLPKFPDHVAVSALAAEARGPIYFPSATVFDFDVILNGMHGAQPTTGLGYLSVPAGASAAIEATIDSRATLVWLTAKTDVAANSASAVVAMATAMMRNLIERIGIDGFTGRPRAPAEVGGRGHRRRDVAACESRCEPGRPCRFRTCSPAWR